MRPVPAALAISVAVHAALVAWIETRPARPQHSALVAPPHVEITEVVPKPAAEPEPMTVALLDDHTVAAPAPGPGSRRHTRTPPAIAATSRPSTRETTGPTAPTAPASTDGHSSLMAMRQPTIEHGRSGGFVAALAGTPQWGHPPSGAELDGQREADIARIEAQNNAELKPDGTGTKSEHTTFKMKFNGDGTVKSVSDKANWQQKSPLRAEFDVTDALMRRYGQDPYASYKKKVLDETREQRFEMGMQYRTQQLAQSRQYMQKNIERLVASLPDPAALKQGLFELWDDCAEAGSAELVAGGKTAREQVMGFVRAKFPSGSANAYTAAELRRFNEHRKSLLAFEPYD